MLRGEPAGATGAGAEQAGARHQQRAPINLETNCFAFGAFEWSLTIVPLLVSSSRSLEPESVCRVYLNRLTGLESLCRVRYRVILGHHQPGGAQSAEFADSRTLDQISDASGRIRGHQFKQTNILHLLSPRQSQQPPVHHHQHHHQHHSKHSSAPAGTNSSSAPMDLRVHIEMFCANTISECRVAQQARKPNEPQTANCCDRNKQSWCVECDQESGPTIKLKLFFMDLHSVPRNHIRYISWIAYLVRRDPRTGQPRDSVPVRNSPHSNYYLQDGIDMGTIMETDVQVAEVSR